MNLSLTNIIAILILWFVVGAFLDILKILVAVAGNTLANLLDTFSNWLKNKDIGFRLKLQELRPSMVTVLLQMVHLVVSAVNLIILLLNLLLKSCLALLTIAIAALFFIPYLLTRIVLRVILQESRYEAFLENLYKTQLAGDATTDAPPPTNKKKDKSQ